MDAGVTIGRQRPDLAPSDAIQVGPAVLRMMRDVDADDLLVVAGHDDSPLEVHDADGVVLDVEVDGDVVATRGGQCAERVLDAIDGAGLDLEPAENLDVSPAGLGMVGRV